jgi:hypothetical protein
MDVTVMEVVERRLRHERQGEGSRISHGYWKATNTARSSSSDSWSSLCSSNVEIPREFIARHGNIDTFQDQATCEE